MNIAKFKVKDREFNMFFMNGEFYLELKRDLKKISAKDDMARLFDDIPHYEDVNENINAFEVAKKSIDIMVSYVYSNNITYFYFHASTDRKAKIYHRLAKRLVERLSGWSYSTSDGSFYFYKG